MSAQVITFPGRDNSPTVRRRIIIPSAPVTAPLTETHENHNARQARQKVWRKARSVTSYRRSRLDWHHALRTAQLSGDIADADRFPEETTDKHWPLLGLYREALTNQFLTPAPDLMSVEWKKKLTCSSSFQFLGISAKRAEQIIGDDIEWLTAHPIRKSDAATKQATAARREQTREFKSAMRQRIREVAESRDLSDDDIAPAMSLKHHAIAKFATMHGVQVGWLLEGNGDMFTTAHRLTLHDPAEKLP